jgi:hypothetical protein
VAIALVATAAVVLYWEAQTGWGRHKAPAAPGAAEERIKKMFAGDAPVRARYDALFDYFASGFIRHAAPGFARIQYPGVGGGYSFRINGLEGFARTAPLLATKVYSGRGTTISDPTTGQPVEIVALLKTGLLAGVDPESDEYWGDVHDFNQRIVESADIARILWLTKAQLWDSLTSNERERITRWLLPVTRARTFDTNWNLFPIVVGLTLARLHEDGRYAHLAVEAQRKFADYRRKSYLESGWFMDEHVDFYNTWGITYELFWIHTIDPTFETEFIRTAIRESALLTEHLISPNGIPIMGRSSCYRTAVPVPVVAEAILDSNGERAGHGLRALDAVWRYFIAHDSLRDGTLTQGYFQSDMRYLDPYSGAGSCHWGLRSLTLAMMLPPDSRFWTDPPAPLPIEVQDYRLEYEKLGWNIHADRESGEILIEIPANRDVALEPERHTLPARVKEMLTREAHRPRNEAMKYQARYYSSAKPFPIHGTYSRTRKSAP